ncbi:MAG: tRNA lysidine(34) synthetase TilS [Clostridia bacterium]|nr:tRNA lysidine(34) synthetase TilS [Clostridia bacterium]
MKTSSAVWEKFSEAVSLYGMLSCSSILVGLSGGADSVVLLHILKKEAAKRGFSLYALHVNHMIRGSEADRDEQFCIDLCRALDIPLKVERIDVPRLAESSKIGLEEAARSCRYSAFASYCQEMGIERIATAHNATDNLETVIFNIARGTSLKGASGIPPVRGNIVRPLILCTKDEIVRYAEENSLSFVYDSTNSDTEYSRNLIRHKIIPEILKINPAAQDAVSRLSFSLREDESFLDSVASELESDDVTVLSRLERPILFRIIKKAYRRSGAAGDLSYVHLCDISDLISKAREHSQIDLPGGFTAKIESSRLIFEEKAVLPERSDYDILITLGENVIPSDGSVIFVCREDGSDDEKDKETCKYLVKNQNIHKIFIKATTTFDIMSSSLHATPKRDGDRIRYGNMTRSVKKLFSEKKIPLSQRATLPVLRSGNKIVWIPGFPVCDDFSSEKSENLPRFSVYYMKGDKDNGKV